MQRSLGLLSIVLLLSACMSAQKPSLERELPVETLTVSDIYGVPAKVAVTLGVKVGGCEQAEIWQRLENRTLQLFAVGYKSSAQAACSAKAQKYTATVISESLPESGTYTVIAGDKRATFHSSYLQITSRKLLERVFNL